MYPPDYLFQRLNELTERIHLQNKKIDELKITIDSLREQLSQPSTPNRTAEKIEYNFDQLKIETLEGTLNIGLTPNQPLPFEKVDLPTEERNSNHFSPIEQSMFNQLMAYIKQELPEKMKQYCEENNITLTEEWKTLIYHDIKKQLGKRIQDHAHRFQQQQKVNLTPEQAPMLIHHIKKEIDQGVQSYLNRLKENEQNESDD